MLKKSIRYCMIILVITSLNSVAYAKEKHFVRIVNATTNIDNEILYINGENFGKNPEIRLDDDILNIQFKSDNYIEALLPNGIEAGTYRLVIDKKKKKGKHHMFPIWQLIAAPGYRDKIDITIGITGPEGPIGETGLQGPAGVKGDKGETGLLGLTGPLGSQGFKGDTGLQGPAGLKGDIGEIGPQGLTGPIGPQGLRGETGLQGPAGLKGDKGYTGLQGLTGPIGFQGLRGETGLEGPAGLKGDQGDTGPQGLTGPIGNTGPQGLKGSNGAKGDKGDPGMSGYGIASRSGSATLIAFGGNSTVLSVSCPSGKKVLGGGGKSDYNGDLLSESYPISDGSGWTIKYTNQSASTKTITLSVYAICAECQ